MAVETVIDNEFVTLMYDSGNGIVHHQFHKFIFGQPFRDALMKGADMMKQRRGTKWLSDDRGNSALPPDDANWAQTVWFPAVVAAGWKHWAIVMPTKVMGQLNMKQWAATYAKLGINSQIFDDPDKAMAWLKAQ